MRLRLLLAAALLAASTGKAAAGDEFNLNLIGKAEIADLDRAFPPAASAPAEYASEEPAEDTAEADEDTGRVSLEGFQDNPTDQPAFKLLNLAKKSIDIEIYEMSDPDVRAFLRQAINRKPKPIRVRIVREPNPVAEKCHYFEPASQDDDDDCRDQKKLISEIRASAGGAYVPFNKEQLCGGEVERTCFQHGKLIIVDKKYAMLSSGNLNSTNLCNLSQNPRVCNRDFSYVTSDPEVVGALSAIFEKDLKGKPYDLSGILSGGAARKITVSPFSRKPLLDFIAKAKKKIRIENQYMKEPAINEALKQKVREGVKVQMMTSSLCSFGKPDLTPALLALHEGFENAGIYLKMFTAGIQIGGKLGYLHSKAIVIDDSAAWIGSVNGSATAMAGNREFGIFFDNPAEVKRLIGIMDSDFKNPEAETWRESLRCKKDYPISSPAGFDQ